MALKILYIHNLKIDKKKKKKTTSLVYRFDSNILETFISLNFGADLP